MINRKYLKVLKMVGIVLLVYLGFHFGLGATLS